MKNWSRMDALDNGRGEGAQEGGIVDHLRLKDHIFLLSSSHDDNSSRHSQSLVKGGGEI